MASTDPASPDPVPAPVPDDAAGTSAPDAARARLEWLFRDSLRRRQLHPLWSVLRQYRQVDPE